jgi:hypothetical protein
MSEPATIREMLGHMTEFAYPTLEQEAAGIGADLIGAKECIEAALDSLTARLATAEEELQASRIEAVEYRDQFVPEPGSVWDWEPAKPHAAVRLVVTAVKWNGEEWWVTTEDASGKEAWNDLGRWVEATVMVEPAPETPFDMDEVRVALTPSEESPDEP